MSLIVQMTVGRARRGPTEEEAQLEALHRQAVESLREATAKINGATRTLGELEDKIDAADGMMREALDNGGTR
jgi:hypothetical protein